MATTQTATPAWDMNNGDVPITTQWPHALHALCMCMFFVWLQLLQFTGRAFTYTCGIRTRTHSMVTHILRRYCYGSKATTVQTATCAWDMNNSDIQSTHT